MHIYARNNKLPYNLEQLINTLIAIRDGIGAPCEVKVQSNAAYNEPEIIYTIMHSCIPGSNSHQIVLNTLPLIDWGIWYERNKQQSLHEAQND